MGRVIIDVSGVELAPDEMQLLKHPSVGGVIFFTRNFQSIEQIQTLVRQIRDVRDELIICVDQEGGRVQRFRCDELSQLPPLAALRVIYDRDPDQAENDAEQLGWLMASEMLALGIDLSFAPVLDVDYGRNEVIADRSFGTTTEQVLLLASAYIRGMHRAGMAVCGKHYPGHGFVDLDSHLALPVDGRPLEAVLSDAAPFAQLAPELDSVMTAHVVYESVDKAPASFSEYWLKKQLRSEMAFEGLIISDDLHMQAAWESGTPADRAAKAIQSGCDVILYCNDPKGIPEVLAAVEALALPTVSLSQLRRADAPSWLAFGDSAERASVLNALSRYIEPKHPG